MKTKIITAGIFALLLVSAPLSATPILHVEIDESGPFAGSWALVSVTGSYEDLADSLMGQNWWNQANFADLVLTSFTGDLSEFYSGSGLGFAYGLSDDGKKVNLAIIKSGLSTPELKSVSINGNATYMLMQSFTPPPASAVFPEIQSAITVPEPGLLSLLGLGLALMVLVRLTHWGRKPAYGTDAV